MSFAIRFAAEAEETYVAVISQLRFRWGDILVKKFEEKVSKTLRLIAEDPLIYPIAKENQVVRKCVLHKNCSMYYFINNNYIEVVYFWDNRQDPLFLP